MLLAIALTTSFIIYFIIYPKGTFCLNNKTTQILLMGTFWMTAKTEHYSKLVHNNIINTYTT